MLRDAMMNDDDDDGGGGGDLGLKRLAGWRWCILYI